MTESFNPLRQKLIAFVETELRANQSDVIHDTLAFLAEQMIELNKLKNEEIKGFLKWLKREIGCEIDDLTGKTAIKDYHEGDIEALLAVLKKNKQKLSIDPSNRKFQEGLEKHYNESISMLTPLKNKIKATDNLINQIVYKLYGLTPEEIEIVEGKK
jgi:polyribonucleotide nucleotidyltransferase